MGRQNGVFDFGVIDRIKRLDVQRFRRIRCPNERCPTNLRDGRGKLPKPQIRKVGRDAGDVRWYYRCRVCYDPLTRKATRFSVDVYD